MSSNTLRISPKYTADDWDSLILTKTAHWDKAVAIVRDRIEGRFLDFADQCLPNPNSGFVVLSIDCLLVETIEQFIEGRKQSKRPGTVFRRFLERHEFQPYFADPQVRADFYADIRCGLLHQAEAKKKWLIKRDQPELLQRVDGDGYVIDVVKFHEALKVSLERYFTDIKVKENKQLRGRLWNKMGFICSTRRTRGAMEVVEAPGAATTT